MKQLSDAELQNQLFEAACNELRKPGRVQFIKSRVWNDLWEEARQRGHPEWAGNAVLAAKGERQQLAAENAARLREVRGEGS